MCNDGGIAFTSSGRTCDRNAEYLGLGSDGSGGGGGHGQQVNATQAFNGEVSQRPVDNSSGLPPTALPTVTPHPSTMDALTTGSLPPDALPLPVPHVADTPPVSLPTPGATPSVRPDAEDGASGRVPADGLLHSDSDLPSEVLVRRMKSTLQQALNIVREDKGFESTAVVSYEELTAALDQLQRRWQLRRQHTGVPGLRSPAPFGRQFNAFARRYLMQRVRYPRDTFLDLAFLILGAIVLGAVYGPTDELWAIAPRAMIGHLTLGLTTTMGSLKVFGAEREVFWRESSSRVSRVAYFLAKMSITMVDVVARPFIFLVILDSMTQPLLQFRYSYGVLCALTWALSGMGYAFSTLLHPISAVIAAVLFPMVTGGVLAGISPSLPSMPRAMQVVAWSSFTRWSVEAVTVEEWRRFPSQYEEIVEALFEEMGYKRNAYETSIIALVCMGGLFRILTFVFLISVNRAKQR